ncbi:MAG: S8 family serine peptidase [Sulfurovum sp.]|nr:S8 family serine peptidase [Sulfurovum sp.]
MKFYNTCMLSIGFAALLLQGCGGGGDAETVSTVETVTEVNDSSEIDANLSIEDNVTFDISEEEYYRFLWHIDANNSSNQAISQEVSDALGGIYIVNPIDENADIHILDAWKKTMGEDVVVAVIDDGADIEHEDLKVNIWKTYNADDGSDDVTNTSTDQSVALHGHKCAGFIAAPVNGKGTIGTAPKSKLLIIKLTDPSLIKTIEAFEYAKNNGAKVVSCSWGTEDVSDAIVFELKKLYDANITVLFASGNEGKSLDSPDIYDESEVEWVIGVGASGENNDVTPYSNYGTNIDVIAPGGDTGNSVGLLAIDDTGVQGSDYNYGLVDNNYAFSSGTSFSTPITAGVVAMIYSVYPNVTPEQVRNILISTADKIGDQNANYVNGFDEKRAYGKVNAQQAIEEAIRLYNEGQ